jgi:hypothetical protein
LFTSYRRPARARRTEPRRPPENPSAAAALVAANLPPQAFFTAPDDGARFAGDTVTVAYRVRSATGGTIDSLAVEVDGRPLVTEKRLGDGAKGEGAPPRRNTTSWSD